MVEQLLSELTAALRDLTVAVRENTAARQPTPAAAAEPTPLERLRASLASVKTERQALNLWEKAVAALPVAERPGAWGELVGQFNRVNARADGDAVLRAALATATASASTKARAPAPSPAPRTTGRAR